MALNRTQSSPPPSAPEMETGQCPGKHPYTSNSIADSPVEEHLERQSGAPSRLALGGGTSGIRERGDTISQHATELSDIAIATGYTWTYPRPTLGAMAAAMCKREVILIVLAFGVLYTQQVTHVSLLAQLQSSNGQLTVDLATEKSEKDDAIKMNTDYEKRLQEMKVSAQEKDDKNVFLQVDLAIANSEKDNGIKQNTDYKEQVQEMKAIAQEKDASYLLLSVDFATVKSEKDTANKRNTDYEERLEKMAAEGKQNEFWKTQYQTLDYEHNRTLDDVFMLQLDKKMLEETVGKIKKSLAEKPTCLEAVVNVLVQAVKSFPGFGYLIS